MFSSAQVVVELSFWFVERSVENCGLDSLKTLIGKCEANDFHWLPLAQSHG